MRQPGTVSLTALRIIIAILQTLSGGTSMKQMKSIPSKLAYMKKYREANRDKINKWRRDNRAIIIPTERIWQEKYKPLKNLRRRNRYKNDPAYKILCSLRNRIRKVLNGKSKSQSTMKLLGCDINTFIKYIESQFIEGMNWNNYNLYGWHLDHIKPCSSFDLTKPEEQKKCFHYNNLQPLWAKDNLSKGIQIF